MQKVSGAFDSVKTKATTTDPCFGCCSLQTATMGVAILNIIVASVYLVVAIFMAIFVTAVGVSAGVEMASTDGDKTKATTGGAIAVLATILGILIIVLFVCVLALGILLYIGAKKRDYSKIRLWFIINLICAVFFVIQSLRGLNSFGGLIEFLLTILICGYQMWIVYAFMHEINPANVAGLEQFPPGTEGGFTGIPTNQDVQFTKNPYEQAPPPPYATQQDNFGWDNP